MDYSNYPKSGPGTEGPDAMLSADCINRINTKILEDNRNVRGNDAESNEYAVPDSKQKSADYTSAPQLIDEASEGEY